jgi:uncharacterized membrane protein
MIDSSSISLPRDFYTNFLMLLRWIHFLAGITWIGLLYFFNLVGFRTMQELDPSTRVKVMPGLMLRAMWWFRWSALVTVLAGLIYWGGAVSALAQAAGATSGVAMGSFFGIWTAAWGVLYLVLKFASGSTDGTRPAFSSARLLTIIALIIMTAASCLFLRLNHHGWETNSMLAIGIGGGIGWVLLLNVWGVVWRIQKRLIAWTKAFADNATPIPAQAASMSRLAFLTSRVSAWLTLPLLFFMGAASHYQMFHG